MVAIKSPSANTTALKSLYSSAEVAKAVLDDFAIRQRNQRKTKLDQLLFRLASSGVSRSEVIRVFRKLEELGYGEFVEGRRGHPSRFEWLFDLVTVGRAAAGSSQVIEEVRTSAEEEDEADALPVMPPGSLSHKFQLRPDWQVDLILPIDFTTREALRLSDFIKTLPFDAAQV
jgi:hypothetical protein